MVWGVISDAKEGVNEWDGAYPNRVVYFGHQIIDSGGRVYVIRAAPSFQ